MESGCGFYDEYQDDVLNFKDSERESLISYLEDNDFNLKNGPRLVDTPTKLINHSNEFLGQQKKIN